MQVWAGDSTSSAYFANHLTFFNAFSRAYVDFAEMGEHGNQALAVVDVNQIAAEKEITHLDHGAGTGRYYRGAAFGCEIHAAMWSARLAIEHAATSETTGANAANRQQKIDIATGFGIVNAGFLFTFFFRQNSIHVTGIRIDLTLVGYRDMLGAVFFIGDGEIFFIDLVVVTFFDKVFARFEIKR